MHDPIGRIVCAVVALGLIWLAVQALRSGSVSGRGHTFERAHDPIMFRATVVAQIGFAIFLAFNAAGIYPWRVLKGFFAG